MKKTKNLREFDNEFTCKILGITLDEYYETHSSYKELDKIEKPVMFVNSIDDPILKAKNLPFSVNYLSTN